MNQAEERQVDLLTQPLPTLIVGLGKSGLSCAQFLARQGELVAVTDSRISPPGLNVLHEQLPDIPVFVGGFDEAAFDAAQRLIISPGVSLQEPLLQRALARGVEVSGDIALFASYAEAPIVAITGSNGKSTVTTLLGEMVKRSGRKVLVGGNIGVPALDLLEQPTPDLYVLELSSFQLETATAINAAVSVVLNISEDHMDRYKDLSDYSKAKQAIFNGAAIRVLNRDDPRVAAMAESGKQQHWFTLGTPDEGEYGLCEWSDELWLACGQQRLMRAADVGMVGRANLANALAALALGDALGLCREAMIATLADFSGLAHRCQLVLRRNGSAWYNDSKATNVGATLAAVNGFEERLVLIAGGDGKGADFTPLHAIGDKLSGLIVIGKDGEKIASILQDSVACQRANSMTQAVEMASKLAAPGESVLLSPACASFDMFDGFEARGEQFISAVRGLSNG